MNQLYLFPKEKIPDACGRLVSSLLEQDICTIDVIFPIQISVLQINTTINLYLITFPRIIIISIWYYALFLTQK